MRMDNAITAAFPASIIRHVQRVNQLLSLPDEVVNSVVVPVLCAGEVLSIPYRVHHPYDHAPSDEEMFTLNETERIIASCWFSRHPNGHVREQFLRLITDFDTPLVVSYVMPLCGEYVVEILDAVWVRRSTFDPAPLGQWLSDNGLYYARLRHRIVSYWNCYYRTKFPRFDDYVGSRLLTFFDELAIYP